MIYYCFRIACRKGSHAGKFPKTAEHSPPFEKGGSGGIFYFLHPRPLHPYPINLLHHRFRFYHYFPAVKIPPAPFAKGGDIWGFLWPIVKSPPGPPLVKGGDILRLSSAACRQVSENSRTFPPFEKGGSGGISIFYIPALSTTTR
jgi:hypothetical protein